MKKILALFLIDLNNYTLTETEVFTDTDILIIGLILYVIGIAFAIYFRHKFMFFVTGLLWFIPIFTVPNTFIILFSSIMIIISGLLAFYNSKESDFD